MSVFDIKSDEADWRARAACRGVDPRVFFPPDSDSAALTAARQMCAPCPVRNECLTEHLYEPSGVFGGLSPQQRRRLLGPSGVDPRIGATDTGPYPNCGTPQGYYRHRREQTETCIACLDARSIYRRQKRAERAAA